MIYDALQALAAAKTEEIKAGSKQIETKKEEKVPKNV